MKKQDKIEYYKVALEMIEKSKKNMSGKTISKNNAFDGIKAKFIPQTKELYIEFQNDILNKNKKHLDLGEYYEGVQFHSGETIYCLESVFLETYSHPKVTGNIHGIHTVGFSEDRKYYYQLVFPLEEGINFRHIIKEIRFNTDLGYISSVGTTAIIDEESIQVRCIEDYKKKYFLVISSSVKQTFDEFVKKANAVQVGLGYLCGYYAGNRGYFFTYTSKEMKQPKHFRSLPFRDSIRSNYTPMCSNPYKYIYYDRSSAEKLRVHLRPVSLKEFSVLCEKIYKSIEFSSALMLILESSVASLLFMPGGYAIALERISDLVIGNKKLKLAPIKDKIVSKKIRKEFLEVLKQNCATITLSDIKTLENRINQFNQTTNKARLKAPFELLGITLSDEDLKILETRNDLLHGRMPDITNAGINRPTNRINKDLFYCSMRLYTLLNIVILKWIGYDNRVINYPKIHEGFTQIPLKEELYR